MMNYFKLVVAIFLAGCSNSEEINYNNINQDIAKINIDIDETEPIFLSDFFSDIKYFYLETPQGHPIGRIEKIQFQDQYIALFDKAKRSVWIFNLDGEYVNEVKIPEGRGPGETEHLLDAYFSEDYKIHVGGNFKIIVYNIDGKLVNEILLDYKINSIHYDDVAKKYYGYSGVSINPQVSDMHRGRVLYVFDDKGSITNSYKPIGKGKEGISFDVPTNFPTFDNNIYFFYHLNDTIYNIEANQLTPKYFLDYGDYSISPDVFDRRNNYGKEIWQWVEFWKNEIEEKNYISYLTNFEQTNSFIHFRIGNSEDHYMVLYDKQNDTTYVGGNNFINDIDFGPSPFIYLSSETELYSYVEANDFLKHMNVIYEDEPAKYGSDKLAKLRDLAFSIDENKNPILMKLTFKNDKRE